MTAVLATTARMIMIAPKITPLVCSALLIHSSGSDVSISISGNMVGVAVEAASIGCSPLKKYERGPLDRIIINAKITRGNIRF